MFPTAPLIEFQREPEAPPGYWVGLPGDRYAMDADLTLYWPDVRGCWEESVQRRTDSS